MKSVSSALFLLLPGIAVANTTCNVPGTEQPHKGQVQSPAQETQGPDLSSLRRFDKDFVQHSPSLKRLASHGAELYDLGTVHGMRTVFARNGREFRVFYITNDDKAAIGGVMWDSTGHNITRDQVSPIPGVIPTVHWQHNAPGPLNPIGKNQISNTSNTVEAGNLVAPLQAGSFGLVGSEKGRRVYMIIDPLCPYSQKAYNALKNELSNGHLQLAIMPIAINDYENNKTSTPSALEMLSVPSQKMSESWENIMLLGGPDPAMPIKSSAAASLELNMAAAHNVGVVGTPTFIWEDSKGKSHKSVGLPDDIETFFKP